MSRCRPPDSPVLLAWYLLAPPATVRHSHFQLQPVKMPTRAVQGGRRYARAHRGSRTPPTARSLARFSGDGSWAESMFGPPIGGGSRLTPERLRRRLCLATSPRSAAAYGRSLPLSGHEPPPETPGIRGRPQAPRHGKEKEVWIFPLEPPLGLLQLGGESTSGETRLARQSALLAGSLLLYSRSTSFTYSSGSKLAARSMHFPVDSRSPSEK